MVTQRGVVTVSGKCT